MTISKGMMKMIKVRLVTVLAMSVCATAVACVHSSAHADATQQLDATMLQTLLNSATSGFAGIAVTKDDSLSDVQSDWFDINQPPAGFKSCEIIVQKPDKDGSETCTFFRGNDKSAAYSADATAEGILRGTLPGWAFHTPNLTHNTLRELDATEPGQNGREANVRLWSLGIGYVDDVEVSSPTTNVSYP